MLPYVSGKCRLTSGYGYRTHPVKGIYGIHGGVDLVGIDTYRGEKKLIRAVCGGTVLRSRIVTNKADATWEWGEYIAILGTDGYTIYYCHLSKRLVQQGEKVSAGQIIGYEGETGQTTALSTGTYIPGTGIHLHFEVRKGSIRYNAAEYLGIANAAGTYEDAVTPAPSAPQQTLDIEPGDTVTIINTTKSGSKTLGKQYNGRQWTVYYSRYTVKSINGDDVLLYYGNIPVAHVNKMDVKKL